MPAAVATGATMYKLQTGADYVAVWPLGNGIGIWSHERSYSTWSPVSTEIGNPGNLSRVYHSLGRTQPGNQYRPRGSGSAVWLGR